MKLTRRDLMWKWLAYGLSLALVTVINYCVLNQLPLGAIPVLLPVTAVAVGVLEGPKSGAGYGMAAGIVMAAATHGSMAWVFLLCVLGWICGLLALYVPTAISEVITYVPMLGSASYITFITGNVMNLKLPVAINAIDIAGVEQSTDEGDAVVTVAVGASSIVTMAIIALGVILLVPLQPIFAIPAVKTATGYMLPALFGGLALGIFNGRSGKYNIKGKLLGAVPAVIIVIILMIMGVPLSTYQGFVIVGMIPVTILTSWLMYKKGIIKVFEQGKTEPEPVASKK